MQTEIHGDRMEPEKTNWNSCGRREPTSNCGNMDLRLQPVLSHAVAYAPRLGRRKSKGGDLVGAGISVDRQLLFVRWASRSETRCMNCSSTWGTILVQAAIIYQLDISSFMFLLDVHVDMLVGSWSLWPEGLILESQDF